ncbi:DUF4394 domain-containing protein [Paraperlucidibaca sp.]|jgi:hypothetical protein|uniref:DUF4394 domain-containing protein n=1 Tax=Paraperlucidibaca sp. TaxID=2708021 RepID=UPI003988DA0E
MSIRFSIKPIAYAVALITTGGLLGACGGGTSDGPRIEVSSATAYLLTSNNRIIGVDLEDTEFARSVVGILTNTIVDDPADDNDGYSVNALDIDEQVLAIDYRNAEGTLYALTRLGSEGRIVTITPTTGVITRVSTLTADSADTTDAFSSLNANVSYTIDFNPTVDRLRIIGSDDSNYRVDVLTGQTFTDGPVSISSATIAGVAYTDNFSAGAGRTTTLFGIDTSTDALYSFSSANAGTLATPSKTLDIGDVTAVNGFDIDPSSNALTAVLSVAGSPAVYSLDATGASNVASRRTSLPKLPTGETYASLSLITAANPTVVVLDNANKLSVLRANDPAVIFTPGTVTLGGMETLIGIDFRQSSRTLNGLGSLGNHYALTVPVNGSTSPTATKLNTSATSLTANVGYTTDFNPTSGNGVNRLRLIGDNDSNAVVEIETGISTPNTAISGSPDPTVVAAAYSNNYRNATSTQLFVVDSANSAIATQTVSDPTAPDTTPVVGQLVNSQPLGITLAGPVGFDISGRNNENVLLLARSAAGPHTLYRVNLGLSTPLLSLGTVGGTSGSSNLIDMAITF